MDKSAPQIYGILGYPAKHSLSPLMHNAAFRALKIHAEYRIFEKTSDELQNFLSSLSRQNICGLNITVPYKEKVIPFLAQVSSEVQLIGAVNTVKVSGNKLEGFNTDGQGFLRHLKELKFKAQGKNIAVLGSGGAAKAVCVYLAQENPKKISLYDIDKQKLSALVRQLKDNFAGTDFYAADTLEDLNTQGSSLLVNATPCGMKESDPLPLAKEFIHKNLFVYDLIYNPQETKLLKAAKESGARISNGLRMLLYQGMLSFEIWTGKPAPQEIMREALEGGLK